MRAQVVRVARKHRVGMTWCQSSFQVQIWNELWHHDTSMQLECSRFFEQFDNSCLGTNLPGPCLHAEGGNSPPCGLYLLQKQTSMHVHWSNGNVWGHIRGCLALRICADRIIITVESGADLVRICTTKFYSGRGAEWLILCMVKSYCMPGWNMRAVAQYHCTC